MATNGALRNFLAFNYSGNFSLNATHDANVYPETNVTALDTDSALNYYLTSGIPSSNISLGIPLFGKSFENTTGLAQPFTDVGPGGPQPLGNGSVLKADERVALASTCLPIASDINAMDPSERPEQIPEIGLRCVLRDVRDAQSRHVIAIRTTAEH